VAIVAVGSIGGCRGSAPLTESDHPTVLAHQVLDAPNPAEPGPHTVATLYYGSGTDKNRPEYRDSVTIVTPTVDASKLVDLSSYAADERNAYWGFTPDSFPLNARVWYPDGDGPFPVVLVVHGNHNMKEFSDPGYAYLGELLASRGFILASVDMNFVNGSIREENDGRGWLLLKHLEAWESFNEDPDNPFHGKVDMTRLAVMGHSRGGEAVGHAAAFNRLKRYPDDATLEFDFDFDIRAVVAIAPVDGQYLPTGRKAPVEDVNYMVFHGSHDGDVTSFHGLRQWDRVGFSSSDSTLFKSAVYVYRANHGQWNEVWGPNDNGPRSARILDLDALMDEEDQREFARLYISAFLEASLRNDKRYLPMFRDHRVVGQWLPPTMYVTRYQTSGFHVLEDFEGDIDVTTGSRSGVILEGDSLSVWREGILELRSSNRSNTSASQENQAVWLGWNRRVAGQDPGALGQPARYTVSLPSGLTRELGVTSTFTLDLSLAATPDTPEPRAGEAGVGTTADGDRDGGEEEPGPAPDLTIEVFDGSGRAARVPLSDYGPIRRPLEMTVLRRRDRDDERFQENWELVLQTYSLPLADFLEAEPRLALNDLRGVRLVFDRTPAGEVVVDDIGFSDLDPAFLSAAVPRSLSTDGDEVPPGR
jgi:dienelactone hydrolase